MPDHPLIRWETDGGATPPSDEEAAPAGRAAPHEPAGVDREAGRGTIEYAAAETAV